MVRVLSDEDIASVLSLPDLLPVVEKALLAQGRGAVERPERPHFPVGIDGDDPLGTGLVMPAAIHGRDHYATKIVSVHEGNPERGLPTVNAQIALTDARTGQPTAFMDGSRITNARTGCIGGLAARELAVGTDALTLGVVGAGAQARWQVRAIAAATRVGSVRVFSPSDSRQACAADLRTEGIDAHAVDSPQSAVEEADVVVTATTSAEPVFPADALADGSLTVAVGAYTADMQEVPSGAIEDAATVFADVPEEVAAIGDVREAAFDPTDLVPFSDVLAGDAGRASPDDRIVVESVGTAVLDAATAEYVYDGAVEAAVGTDVELS